MNNYFNENNFYLIAHRGITTSYEENTLESINSIKKYKNLGYKIGAEFDLMFTNDNEIICFHDFNLKRMTNFDKNINDINKSEINSLKIKEKYKIPFFKDILESFKNENLLLDIEIKDNIKNDKLNLFINKFINLIRNYNYTNFIIKSYNHLIIDKIKSKIPDIKCGYLFDNFDESYLNYKNSILFFYVNLLDEKYCKENNLISINKYLNQLMLNNELGCFTLLSKNSNQNEKLIINSIKKFNIKYLVSDNIFQTIFDIIKN